MLLKDYVDMNNLENYVEEGLISRRFHPKWPLAILNYTKRAMDKTHDDDTLRRCRGLIYDIKIMQVVARPMEAFFNVNDTRYPETRLEALTELVRPTRFWKYIPGSLPEDQLEVRQQPVIEVTEKLDGSMGIVYQYADNPPEVATRGSFESPQAKWGTEYLQRTCKDLKVGNSTLIVEIIYPGNQIVVDYGERSELVLLAMIETETGIEGKHWELEGLGKFLGLPVVPLYNKSPAQCAIENERNREGYVLKFTIPGRPVQRFKAKFEDYRAAHKAMFGMNSRDVWGMLKDGKSVDFTLFEGATLWFKVWLYRRVCEFSDEFDRRKDIVKGLLSTINHGLGTGMKDAVPLRKYVAEFIKYHAPEELVGACFAAYDGKDYEAVIWKGLRPARAVSYKEMPVEAE